MPKTAKTKKPKKSIRKAPRDDIGFIAKRLTRAVVRALGVRPAKAKEPTELDVATDAVVQAHEHLRMQDAGFADILAKVYDELKKLNARP